MYADMCVLIVPLFDWDTHVDGNRNCMMRTILKVANLRL